MSLSNDDDSDNPDTDSCEQKSLDDLVKPADWPADRDWATLTIDAYCTPADITYATDLMLLNKPTESINRAHH